MKVLVLFSGGKDSQASLIWAVKEYGKEMCEAVFCDTGWENPATYEHIDSVCKQMNVPLKILKNEKYDGLVELSLKKGRFPSTRARFCTEELKVKPTIDYVLSLNDNLIIIEGIRKGESHARSFMEPQCMFFKYYLQPLANGRTHTYRKKDILEWIKKYNADKVRPIFDWTAQQTIDYIRDNGQQPNPLYYAGFTRVGCFPCIMARHRSVKLIIDNHPEQWELLKREEGRVGRSFFPPDYIPKYACSGVSSNGKKFPTAEDVEKYLLSKNATLDLWEDDTPSCMSAYGLCE